MQIRINDSQRDHMQIKEPKATSVAATIATQCKLVDSDAISWPQCRSIDFCAAQWNPIDSIANRWNLMQLNDKWMEYNTDQWNPMQLNDKCMESNTDQWTPIQLNESQ